MSGSAGSRAATIAVALLVGVVYGGIATVGHRHAIRIGEVVIPWGIVAALAGVACLLLGLRLVLGRLAAGCAAAGLVGMVALLTLPGLGGSVLVAGDVLGTVWAVAPALIAVLVVAWPNVAPRRRTSAVA
ncbi:hypothetical protein ACDF64_17235 [Agromyces sp. MMS24-JH15]|uniref:hypothetical protein n=1 Tax=Agromyces sp. MMS24-JH15 TaxID=3243765 RepID=UPI00374A4D20